jgi:3-isopropylmalate dehydrogenase
MIMSGQMLFEWLGRKRNEPHAMNVAKLIEAAADKVIAEARGLTGDLGDKASTTDMRDAIVGAM